MNTNERTRLSRDFVTRTAWLYEYRVNNGIGPDAWKPVSRKSYTRLSISDILRLEASEIGIATTVGIAEIYETEIVVGESKPMFLKSPVLYQGERVQLNT